MENVDFFSEDYVRESERMDVRFGIVDGVEQGGAENIAFTTIENETHWNAIVTNLSRKALIFMPLDHNIVIHPRPDTIYSLCDGMLYDTEKQLLLFVELKVKGKTWLGQATKQLKSTISLFKANHNTDRFKKKVAYAANKKHPCFQYSKKDDMQRFKNETGFRLLVQNKIKI